MLKYHNMLGIKNRLLHYTLLSFLTVLMIYSCKEKSEDLIIYYKPKKEISNPTCAWLKDAKNYEKRNYMDVFYNYYNKKISEKDFLNAAKALDIVSVKKVYYYTYDDKFMETIKYFSENYINKIPKPNRNFIYSYYGDYYCDIGNYKKSINYYSKVTLLKPTDYDSCIDVANAYYDLSFSYFSLGEQDLALKNSMLALKYFNKTESYTGRGSVYSTLSSISVATKNYKLAEQYGKKALEFYKKDNDTTNIVINLYNKIHNYEESNNPKMYALIDSTYNYYNEIGLKNTSLKIGIYTYYTKKLLNENKFKEARKILDDLRPEVIALNSNATTQEYNIGLAEYEVKKNKGIKDVEIIKNAIPSLIENQNYQIVLSYYDLLKQDAVMKNDYKSAYLYEKEIANAADSLASNQMKTKVLELDKEYQTNTKIQQIKLQEKIILNKNIAIALLASTIIGIFLTIILIYYQQKQKQFKSEKIKTQQYTKQLLEKTEEERKRIASDLHDSVSHELLSLKNSLDDKTFSINKKIDAIINDIRSISRNLHPVMFDKIGLKASVEQLVERAQSFNDFLVTADINYTPTLSTTDELQLYRIIQEALSNIIKYSNAIAAKIKISEDKSSIYIKIKDNGKGFNVSETLEKKDAFGLHNIIERSRAIGGEAKITSDKNGTTIKIEIKKL